MKSEQDLSILLSEAEKLQYRIDDGNVSMAHGIELLGNTVFRTAALELARARGQRILKIMIHKLAPTALVPKHRDWVSATESLGESPCLERWHLPIQTNKECFWWDEKHGEKHFPVGVWSGPVPYWILHTVINRGSTERIHLIVDLDSPKSIGKYE